jgi:hypothetical protein
MTLPSIRVLGHFEIVQSGATERLQSEGAPLTHSPFSFSFFKMVEAFGICPLAKSVARLG